MTHKNWKDVVMRPAEEVTSSKLLGLVHQLKQLADTNQELREQLRIKETELRRERAARANALASIEEAYQTAKNEWRDAEEANIALLKTNDTTANALDATMNRLKAMGDELPLPSGTGLYTFIF